MKIKSHKHFRRKIKTELKVWKHFLESVCPCNFIEFIYLYFLGEQHFHGRSFDVFWELFTVQRLIFLYKIWKLITWAFLSLSRCHQRALFFLRCTLEVFTNFTAYFRFAYTRNKNSWNRKIILFITNGRKMETIFLDIRESHPEKKGKWKLSIMAMARYFSLMAHLRILFWASHCDENCFNVEKHFKSSYKYRISAINNRG